MVAIKDIEMPKSCAECEHKCKHSYDAGYSFQRSSSCPLIEVELVSEKVKVINNG